MSPRRQEISEDVDDILEEVGLTPDILKALQVHPEGTKMVAELANRMRISESSMKRARRDLPSFSHSTWKQVAAYFNLNSPFRALAFHPIQNFGACFLPPSFHRYHFARAWSTMDLYSEELLEAPRMRLLDSFLIPIFGLFTGRVADLPEMTLADTVLSSGGSADRKLFVVGNVLFLVIEPELVKNISDSNHAQLFTELYSATELNAMEGFRSLTVYGLLTDMGIFEFYSFDPISRTFYRDPKMTPPFIAAAHVSSVSNKIFSLVLQGFIDTLKVICDKIEENSVAGSLSRPGSSLLQRPLFIPRVYILY
ncbi:hypothetical protein B0H17DRAFT_1196138 [Mycena rosella]|uniref:Uncharacterized protein n=1 Tax=Mycena rosella TaxID=1033263 RepID=A0AAD7GLD9_MYCRO|nr:hypothetical protein B0H17DRAFT_1196138 [Mycena rosella]